MSKSKKSGSSSSRRERRAFSVEFKREAVRLMQDRRKAGVSLAQVGRELDVRPDQLRAWAQELGENADSRGNDVGDAPPSARFMPWVSDIAVDVRGFLWVQQYTTKQDPKPRLWTVFEPDGKLVTTVRLPRNFEIREIGEDYVLGTTKDPEDGEKVVLLGLRRNRS